MRKTSFVTLFFLISCFVFAVPAKRVKRTLQLADGTQVQASYCGDENIHFYMSSDGKCYRQTDDGIAFQVDGEKIRSMWNERLLARNKARTLRKSRSKVSWDASSNEISGNKKGLVILVNFADNSLTYSQSEYDKYFNQQGYSNYNMSGSVHDYFFDQSFGKLNLSFDVVGPVTVSKGYTYYGANDSQGDDKHPAEMVCEAVRLANPYVDYKDYDWDDDGFVDQVYVVYAGYGEAQADNLPNTIWPHEWQLSSAASFGDGDGCQVLDGVNIDTYACSCELSGSSGTSLDGIGTACHEFSHCMGLPDMYDVNGSNFGMDSWDLMDYGSYNGINENGTTPASYTSYEKMYCGWLTPTTLTDPCFVSDMKPLSQFPEAYIIYNSGCPSEYYLLENRQQVGWDKYLHGHGMLVLHVDYDANVWYNNTVNTDARHQRMTIIAADNRYDSSVSSLAGDPWPGTKNKSALTDSSTPAATLYNTNALGQKYMGHPITDIAEANGTISFTFDGGFLVGIPQALDPELIATDGFTARWSEVSDADYYQVRLFERSLLSSDPYESLLLEENFSGFNNGGAGLGTVDISSSLDKYTSVSGWTGSKLYTTSDNEVKMGSGSAVGQLTTPKLQSQEGEVTILLGCRKYSNDSGSLNVECNSSKIGSMMPMTQETFECFKTSLFGAFNVNFKTSLKRAYISYIGIFDGDFDKEELLQGLEGRKVRRSVSSKDYDTSDTFYKFEGLDVSNLYSYQVRAVIGDVFGEWSNTVDVTLSDEDAIQSSQIGIKSSVYYDLQGRCVERPKAGIYLHEGKKIVIVR